MVRTFWCQMKPQQQKPVEFDFSAGFQLKITRKRKNVTFFYESDLKKSGNSRHAPVLPYYDEQHNVYQ